MNKRDAKKVAQYITNEQLQEMFNAAKLGVKDWTKVSSVNKGMTKGTSWNILAKNFDINVSVVDLVDSRKEFDYLRKICDDFFYELQIFK